MLSKCLGESNYIRHRVYRDTMISSWYAHVSDKIVYTDETDEDVVETTFETLDEFVLAHYEAEGILPQYNAWEECETCVYGTWKPLQEMRESHIRTQEGVKRRASLIGDLL